MADFILGRPKVLFVINSLGGGGAQKLLVDHIRNIKNNCDCTVMFLNSSNDKYRGILHQEGIETIQVPPRIRNHLGRIIFIKNYIRQNDFDIVHANLFPVFYYCSIAKKLTRTGFPKLVMTEHNTDNRRRHHKSMLLLEKWIYSSFDKIVSISKGTEDALIEWIGIHFKDKCITINNGVPINEYIYANSYNKSELCSKFGETDIVLCMVGSFTPQKNHKFIISVLRELPEKYKIVFLGEGPLLSDVKTSVYKYDLDERVAFLGFRKDVAQIIKTSDVMVIPSLWEGFGLVAVEAMACSTPIVYSNVPGLSDVILDAGISSGVEDSIEFANSIMKLEDCSIYSKCKNKCLERARLFDIDKMSNKYLELYNEIKY